MIYSAVLVGGLSILTMVVATAVIQLYRERRPSTRRIVPSLAHSVAESGNIGIIHTASAAITGCVVGVVTDGATSKPARRSPRWLSRLLVRLGGASPDLVLTYRANRAYYTALGSSILLSSLIWAVSAYSLAELFEIRAPFSQIDGLLAGTVIGFVQQSQAMSAARRPRWQANIVVVTARLTLSLILAGAVVLPLLLTGFQNHVDDQTVNQPTELPAAGVTLSPEQQTELTKALLSAERSITAADRDVGIANAGGRAAVQRELDSISGQLAQAQALTSGLVPVTRPVLAPDISLAPPDAWIDNTIQTLTSYNVGLEILITILIGLPAMLPTLVSTFAVRRSPNVYEQLSFADESYQLRRHQLIRENALSGTELTATLDRFEAGLRSRMADFVRTGHPKP
jgi:uncharacterized membrane protein